MIELNEVTEVLGELIDENELIALIELTDVTEVIG